MKQWISWYQPTADYRPITVPKTGKVEGYWCSGSRCSDDAWTMCAIAKESTEEKARKLIKKHWPEATEWRFCESVEDSWLPNDRFPMKTSGNKKGT